MTPKQKAYQLHQKFFNITPEYLPYLDCLMLTKKSAIIAVDEMMKDNMLYHTDGTLSYWEEVKQEIEKI